MDAWLFAISACLYQHLDITFRPGAKAVRTHTAPLVSGKSVFRAIARSHLIGTKDEKVELYITVMREPGLHVSVGISLLVSVHILCEITVVMKMNRRNVVLPAGGRGRGAVNVGPY